MAQRPAAALVALGLVTLTVVVALSATGAEAVFFRIAEGEEKCFLEDVPEDVLVVVHYHIHHHEDDQADVRRLGCGAVLRFRVGGKLGQHGATWQTFFCLLVPFYACG